MMDDLNTLADRVEAVGAGSRELDAEIQRTLGDGSSDHWFKDHNGKHVSDDTAPAYSTSIDAALTLVPDGWAVEALSIWPSPPEKADNVSRSRSSVRLVGMSMERWGKRMIWGHSGKDGRVEGEGETPALALTAAALRAGAKP